MAMEAKLAVVPLEQYAIGVRSVVELGKLVDRVPWATAPFLVLVTR